MSKDPLERRLRDQIDEWNAQIDALRAKLEGAGPEARAEYEKRIEALSEEVEAAMHKLEELRQGGSPAWQTTAENWGEGM